MSKAKSFARAAVIGAGLLALTACSNLDDTQQKVLSGGAAGAVIGTVGVAITGGCIPCGTAIGGAVGAGTGYLLDQMDKGTKSNSSAPPANYTPTSSYNAAPAPGYTTSSNNVPVSTAHGDTSSAY
jgi:hypothetical protein